MASTGGYVARVPPLSGPVLAAPSTSTDFARSCEPLISVFATSPVTPGASSTKDSGLRMLPLTESGRSRTCFSSTTVPRSLVAFSSIGAAAVTSTV
jgi:hypothetical protein